jgi:putative ABC transport system ATP-binding protein
MAEVETGNAVGRRQGVAVLVELCEVSKRYTAGGVPALDHVSVQVAAGEAVAVMGPSGSGKSTLLNLVAGLDKPSAGAVTVAGQRVDTMGETRTAQYRRTQVGVVFQFFNLVEDLTVTGNVMLPARLAGVRRCAARARAGQLLTQLGIDRYRDTYPGRLSGGERQRVAIARALVNNPAVLLADEPTGAVNTAAGRAIGQLLLDLNAAGQTLLIVTHNPELAERYASRVIQLADGRVVSDTATTAHAGPAGAPGARP